MRRLAGCVLVCVLASGAGEAAQVSGFVEASYTWNLDNPPGAANDLRHYDEDPDTVLLNAAHLEVKDEFSERARYKLAFDIGYNNYVETGPPLAWSESLIQEAYVDAKAPDSDFGLRAGKLQSFCGVEDMNAPGNPTMSRGLLFTCALPRTYTGALLTYSGQQFDAAVGCVNGWDVLQDNNRVQTLVANVDVRPDERLGFRLGYMKGPEDGAGAFDRSTVDVVLSFKIERQAEFEVEYTSTSQETAGADDEWFGIAFQARFKPRLSDVFSLGFRAEVLDDSDNTVVPFAPQAGQYSSFTLAPAFALTPSTTLRLEVRIDKADYDYFTDSAGNPTDTQKTLAMQVYTTF